MTIQLTNPANNISFQGSKVKKTPRGNKYEVTHMARTTGGTVGLLSGALASKLLANQMKTISGKKMFIQSLKNMGKNLNEFGPSGKRQVIAKGITALAVGISLLGMFVGAAIGGTIDSHNNQNRAKAADKAAKANP